MFISQLLTLAPITAIVLVVLTAALGAVFGSFVNCIAWRRVHGESAMHGRSHCPHCNHDLGASDLIPVLSWIRLGGRCRYCKQRIGVRYVVSELVCACAFVIVIWCYGLTVQGIALCALCCILLALSLTDLESRIIPNAFILTGIIIWAIAFVLATFSTTGILPQIYVDFCTLGVMGNPVANPLVNGSTVQLGSLFLGLVGGSAPPAVALDSLAGGLGVSVLMLVCSFLFDLLTGKRSLGGGDIKLFFLTGLFLGLAGNLLNLLLSCIVGVVFGMAYGRVRGQGAGSAFPFGPAIALSTFVCLAIGPVLVGAYLSLFGL